MRKRARETRTCRVEIEGRGTVLEVPFGTVLQDLARDHQLPLEFGCRRGTCGTCLVFVHGETPPMTRLEEDTLLVLGAEPGQRLACRLAIIGDIRIRTER
ncbi:MAG: 2Fe-2S iron-sulfur cluster-binding protein [Planctomycetota bacterium]